MLSYSPEVLDLKRPNGGHQGQKKINLDLAKSIYGIRQIMKRIHLKDILVELLNL